MGEIGERGMMHDQPSQPTTGSSVSYGKNFFFFLSSKIKCVALRQEWGVNLLSRLKSSSLASTVLGDVVKVIQTLGGCFNQMNFNVSVIPETSILLKVCL